MGGETPSVHWRRRILARAACASLLALWWAGIAATSKAAEARLVHNCSETLSAVFATLLAPAGRQPAFYYGCALKYLHGKGNTRRNYLNAYLMLLMAEAAYSQSGSQRGKAEGATGDGKEYEHGRLAKAISQHIAAVERRLGNTGEILKIQDLLQARETAKVGPGALSAGNTWTVPAGGASRVLHTLGAGVSTCTAHCPLSDCKAAVACRVIGARHVVLSVDGSLPPGQVPIRIDVSLDDGSAVEHALVVVKDTAAPNHRLDELQPWLVGDRGASSVFMRADGAIDGCTVDCPSGKCPDAIKCAFTDGQHVELRVDGNLRPGRQLVVLKATADGKAVGQVSVLVDKAERPARPCPSPPGARTSYEKGLCETDVAAIQSALNIAADGVIGPQTRCAVKLASGTRFINRAGHDEVLAQPERHDYAEQCPPQP